LDRSTIDLLIIFVQFFFFFQAEDGIRDGHVTGVQTCALPISAKSTPSCLNAAICWNERALRCQSRKLGYETHVRGKRGLFSQTITKRSELTYCSGANTTPCITLNIAVLAPMPRARVSTATAVNPGDLHNMRRPKRKS